MSKEARQLEYFNKLANSNSRYDNYLNKLTEEKKSKIAVNLKNQGVYTASPLTCHGPDKCPFFASCPINDVDVNGKIQKANLQDYPIGMSCVLEKNFVEQQIIDYIQHLDVDPSNPVEMSIINELALIDLYKQRSITVLSNGDKNGFGRDFLLTEITGFNENGDVATQTKLHPLLELIDKLERRRERWLEKLMETRKSKADFVSRLGNENQNSKVLGEIQKLREALLIAQENVIVVKDEILLDDAK